MTPPPSPLRALPPLAARALLALLIALIAAGVAIGPARTPGPHLVAAGRGDAALYAAIARRTAAGGGTAEAYYRAAALEQRNRGYPLRPFVTVREPALALLAVRIGSRGVALLFRLLVLAAVAMLAVRLVRGGGGPVRVAAALIAAVAVAALADPGMASWHEAWAALLLAIAVAGAGGRGWPLAVGAGLLAALVRELTVPMLVALALVAALERRRGEAIGWAAALALFGIAYGAHAHAVAQVVRAGDLASPGWVRLGGWGFVIGAVRHSGVLLLLPGAASAVLVPLALIGWAARGDGFGTRVALALAFELAPFMAIGRPDNVYWGLLVAPLLPIGLAFAPGAIADLMRAARHRPLRAPWNAPWTADASS